MCERVNKPFTSGMRTRIAVVKRALTARAIMKLSTRLKYLEFLKGMQINPVTAQRFVSVTPKNE